MHNIFLGELRRHWREVWKVGGGGGRGEPGANCALHSPKDQEAQLRRIQTALETRAERTLADTRKDYLSAVARHNRVVGITASEPTRRQYADALINWVNANGIGQLQLPPVMDDYTKHFRLPYDEPPKPPHFRPSSEDISQIQKDIDATILPSWLEKVPSTFGDAKHGKLKADHWRTVSTVNLVITLVRRWGSSSSTPEELDALKNYLHLVIAADFASRRSMTYARAAAYEYHMEEYCRGIIRIYKYILVPNHHLALHLRRLLESFGPVHGWWTFPFERYNGLLQRMKTNFKPAEMPKTFMRYWYIGTALRWLMRTIPWPALDDYDIMLRSFEKAFSDTVRGTRVTDILASGGGLLEPDFEYNRREETPLTAHIYGALLRLVNTGATALFQSADSPANNGRPRLHPAGQFVSFIHWKGVRFATRQKGPRDSFIIFRTAEGATRAGQISEIFYHLRTEHGQAITEPYLIVDAYSPLTPADAAHDPYRKFPELETRLYYDRFDATQHLVPTSNIVAHFAAFKYIPDEIEETCVVARNLDRVSM
ncbi:hypothetical protein K466DRAFT_470042, partial [Polyporus arcularius HHB13444]